MQQSLQTGKKKILKENMKDTWTTGTCGIEEC
jgi:hypothetical protein